MSSLSRICLPVLLSACLFSLGAETRFDSLDLDDTNSLLFSAHVEAPGYGPYNASFKADVEKLSITPLTFFPEGLTWLDSTREIQIQNRFGVFRWKESTGQFAPLKGFANFLTGGEIRSGKLGAVQTSPDGRYLAYLRETSPAYGELVILDVVDSKETVASTQIELSLKELKVRWSPDSRVFIYQKANRLYYYSLDQQNAGRMLGEDIRAIGTGQIASVQWGRYNQLVYLKGNLVYEILVAEMFTRSLYQDFLKIGRIVGDLPQRFDPVFDRFWLSPEGDKLLLDKGGNSLFMCVVGSARENSDGKAIQLPCLLLPGNMRLTDVVWGDRDQVILLTRNRIKGNESSQLYRLNAEGGKSDYRFYSLDAPYTLGLSANPDGFRVTLLGVDGIQVRTIQDWKLEQAIAHPEPEKLVYIEENVLILAGHWYGERITLGKKPGDTVRRDFLFFSQAEEAGFDVRNGRVILRSKDRRAAWDDDRKSWIPNDQAQVRKPKTASPSFRVYLEQLYSGPYANMVMVRKVKEPGTIQLFQPPQTVYEDFPAVSASDKVDLDNFQHGDRQRKRAVSLTFNGIDSIDGLEQILETLSAYGIKATFFLNGEFIRRYPWATREIAEAGHEVASMFYMYFNMSDPRYQINSDFIRQGLSRNEQDYFEATGKELSLLWRTPYYLVNDVILKAGKDLKYTLVGKDVDSLDNITRGQKDTSTSLYHPASDLVEMILKQKKPGSVIAMTIGRPGYDEDTSLGRDDYLFEKLDILINNLIQKGYVLVPVSNLIEAAR